MSLTTNPGATAGYPSRLVSLGQLRRAGSRPPGGSFGGLAEMPLMLDRMPDRLPVRVAALLVLGALVVLWGGALALLLAVLR